MFKLHVTTPKNRTAANETASLLFVPLCTKAWHQEGEQGGLLQPVWIGLKLLLNFLPWFLYPNCSLEKAAFISVKFTVCSSNHVVPPGEILESYKPQILLCLHIATTTNTSLPYRATICVSGGGGTPYMTRRILACHTELQYVYIIIGNRQVSSVTLDGGLALLVNLITLSGMDYETNSAVISFCSQFLSDLMQPITCAWLLLQPIGTSRLLLVCKSCGLFVNKNKCTEAYCATYLLPDVFVFYLFRKFKTNLISNVQEKQPKLLG